MTVRQPGRYGDVFYLKEHKLCPRCAASETRLDARFCCWCGVAFDVVYINSFATVTRMVSKPMKEAERASQAKSHHTDD